MPQTEIVIRLGPEEENRPSQTWSHPSLPCLRKGHPDRKARELGVHPDAPFLPSCIQSFICCCCCCLVTKSCLTLTRLHELSWTGSSGHGVSQARILEWGCHFLLQGIFLTQRLNSSLLPWQVGSLPLSHQRNRLFHWALSFFTS